MAFQPNSVPVLLEAAITTVPASTALAVTVQFNGGAPLQHTYQVVRMFFRKTNNVNGAFADTLTLQQTTPLAVVSALTAALSLNGAPTLGTTADFVASNGVSPETAVTPLTLNVGNTLQVVSAAVVNPASDIRGIVYIEAYRVS